MTIILRMLSCLVPILGCTAAAIAAIMPVAQLRFQVTPLAFPRNANVFPGDVISTSGYVVGFGGANNVEPLRWDASGAVMTLADPLGNPTPVPDCRAYAVNNAGQAVGAFTTNAEDYRPVKWNSPTTATLLSLLGSYSGATPLGLNEAGQAVGVLQRSSFDNLPVMWSPSGTATQIMRPMGYNAGQAQSINNNGIIVGSVMTSNFAPPRAVKWIAASDSGTILPQPLGTSSSRAFDVNDAGQAVGWGDGSTGTVALRWDAAGNVTRLLPPVSVTGAAYAFGIDENARAAGMIGNSAYLWDENGVPYPLDSLLAPGSPALHFYEAYAIESDAQLVRVVASTSSQAGITGYYLLTAPIPEPAAAVILPLLLVLRLRRRRNG